MSHYERRLQHDLEALRRRISGVAVRVEDAIRFAVHALIGGDSKLANDIALNDLDINRTIRDIDRQCHAFVALHLPSAGHLRFISSSLRLTVALERIGDHAVTISRASLQLSKPPPPELARDIALLSDQAREMLHQAMAAWNEESVDLARGTKMMADLVERTRALVLSDLLEPRDFELSEILALFTAIGSLERVSDLAKNICEETVFTITGQTKPPKVYKVLFADESGAGLSALAQAVARKTYPNSGDYHSGGWAAAAAFPPHLAAWMDRLGLALPAERPSPLPQGERALSIFHVIVGLSPDTHPRLGRVPFHTAYQEWDLGPAPDADLSEERLDVLYRDLAHAIGELMVKLRGEGAD